MLALHLLQSALVHVHTLLVQQALAEPAWAKKPSDEDRRGLTALFWSNVNPSLERGEPAVSGDHGSRDEAGAVRGPGGPRR
ncbi:MULTISPECIES: Tn3 family transposase [Streptomyces]|uniref:Tn3 family transposase n=1 Tax=Streptomyces TaxID=1883 RepID=UPI001CCBDD55|nr:MULTISPECIES: Tn3 family transposase [Streptomyces]UBI36561.1 Tn3 family transposase [Streptomyces mobaraensis]UKW29152.1 Tn3 family transposase [Streptomyces sp. TYQ1024]